MGKRERTPLLAVVGLGGVGLFWLLRHNLLASTLAVAAIWSPILARKGGLDRFGFSRRHVARDLAAGFLLGTVIFCLVIGALVLGGWYRPGRFALRPLDMVYALAFFFVAAAFEELLDRRIIFGFLERKLGSWWALAISSLAFGALHFANPHASVVAALNIAVEAGILFGALYMLTRTLWLPIGAHMAWNVMEGPVFGTPVSGLTKWTRSFHSVTRGPALWTGGRFGPEAGLVALIVGTACGAVALAVAARRGCLRVALVQEPEPLERQPGLDQVDPA